MTLRIGFVGTGSFAKKHAAMVAREEGVRVVAFCGTSLEKAQAAAGLFQSASGGMRI